MSALGGRASLSCAGHNARCDQGNPARLKSASPLAYGWPGPSPAMIYSAARSGVCGCRPRLGEALAEALLDVVLAPSS